MKFSIVNLLSLVAIAALVMALVAKPERKLTIDSPMTSYSWELRESLIAKSPVWENHTAAPPMHLGDAVLVTDEIITELNHATKPLGMEHWRLDGIALSALDGVLGLDRQRWCYLARFSGLRHKHYDNDPKYFEAIILMDGNIVVGDRNRDREIDDLMRKRYP